MTVSPLPALITLLTVILMFATAALVGRARHRFGVKAPATTGPIEFERAYRVQMNTQEAALMFLPSFWLMVIYGRADWALVLGAVWLLARVWYAWTYARGANRGPAFTLGLGVNMVVLLFALWGVIEKLMG